MKNLIPTSYTGRAVLILQSFVLVIIIIGSLIPDPVIEKKPWIPRSSIKKSNRKTFQRPAKKSDGQTDHSASFDSEVDEEESNEWQDFLEEIECLGYGPYDPEAKEIWENNYK